MAKNYNSKIWILQTKMYISKENRYIITWMLHHIFTFCNKMVLPGGKSTPFTLLPPYWRKNWLINEDKSSNLNWTEVKFFQVLISMYIISIACKEILILLYELSTLRPLLANKIPTNLQLKFNSKKHGFGWNGG